MGVGGRWCRGRGGAISRVFFLGGAGSGGVMRVLRLFSGGLKDRGLGCMRSSFWAFLDLHHCMVCTVRSMEALGEGLFV